MMEELGSKKIAAKEKLKIERALSRNDVDSELLYLPKALLKMATFSLI